MMTLLSAPASPYSRKVTMTAILKGLIDSINIEAIDTSVPANEALRARNPLQKIPVLVLADGTEIYDSRVICEYLDSLAPAPALLPASGMERFLVLRQAALADGIMDASILLVYEKRFRPEKLRSESWSARQQAKIDTALDILEAAPPTLAVTPDLGQVGLAAALGYLDFRQEGKWRAGRPRLVAWLDRFAAEVPAYGMTHPK